MKTKSFLFLTILIMLFLIIAINILSAQDQAIEDQSEDFYFSDITLNTGRGAGIISCFLLGLTIFIGGSSRLLDKAFGLDAVLRFHKKIAFISFCILFLHLFFITISNMIEGTSIIEFYSSYIGDESFLVGVIAFIIFALMVISTLLLYKILNFFIWLTIHRLSIIAFGFAVYHVFNFGVLSGFNAEIPLLNVFIYSGIIFAALGLIIRIILLFLKKKKISIIVDIKKEIFNTNSVIVKKPEGFIYKPGQFCFISFYKKGLKTPHPFTISSSPDEENLVFTIKSSGKFTNRIVELKKGDRIKIDGPYGIFTFRKKDSILIAGGVGITPFRSILADKMNFIKVNKVKLIYSIRTKKEIIFYEWLEKLRDNKKYFPLEVVYVLTDEKSDGYEYGMIDDVFIKKHIDFNCDYYICGPSFMRKDISNILKKNKIKKIYSESFFIDYLIKGNEIKNLVPIPYSDSK